MDIMTESLINSFRVDQGFGTDISKPTLFEHFANFCVISKEYPSEFNVEEIHVGGGNDLQLDGVAVIVNGVLINSTDEVDDLAETNKHLDVEFIFIQAKSGRDFEGSEISDMFNGAHDVFLQTTDRPRNEEIVKKEKIIRHIYSKSTLFRRGSPKLKLYYVTTGTWCNDKDLVSRIKMESDIFEKLNMFQPGIKFEPVDARKLQQYYNYSQNVFSKTIPFVNNLILPSISNVKESYLGYLPASEYIKIITDDDGNLLRNLFNDNVRDYQGDNPVNIEIEKTLSSDIKDAFILLNNGITVVSEDIIRSGNNFTITGFQIVNGGQTSHVLFNNKDKIDDRVYVPIKLIISPEIDLKNQVIRATNQQTPVKSEDLTALTEFQKDLERYYGSIPKEHRLYYERRSGQYRSVTV